MHPDDAWMIEPGQSMRFADKKLHSRAKVAFVILRSGAHSPVHAGTKGFRKALFDNNCTIEAVLGQICYAESAAAKIAQNFIMTA